MTAFYNNARETVRLLTTSTTPPSNHAMAVSNAASYRERTTRAICGWAEETCADKCCGPANGLEVHLRGQGPRGYSSAAHGVHACESRDAGREPPFRF